MNRLELFRGLGNLDADLIREAEASPARKQKKWWQIALPIAACLALAIGIGTSSVLYARNSIELSSESEGVRARYVHNAPEVSSTGDLLLLTEAEMFTRFDTAIFRGTVTQVENIRLDFAGETVYRAIAHIHTEEVYRGNCRAGEDVRVLLPCTIGTGETVTDAAVASAIRPGMTGIFMPIQYGEDDYWEQNGARLREKDLCAYGLADGERWVFLETGGGLLFDRTAFPTIAGADTLMEVEDYILKMVNLAE